MCESGQLVFLLKYMRVTVLTHFETLEFFNCTMSTISVCSPAQLLAGVVKRCSERRLRRQGEGRTVAFRMQACDVCGGAAWAPLPVFDWCTQPACLEGITEHRAGVGALNWALWREGKREGT